MTHADLHAFQRAPRERREPNKREAQRIEKLQAKMQEVAEAIDAATDAEDEDKADALQEEGEALGELCPVGDAVAPRHRTPAESEVRAMAKRKAARGKGKAPTGSRGDAARDPRC
mgnify:CR=1 FL=1